MLDGGKMLVESAVGVADLCNSMIYWTLFSRFIVRRRIFLREFSYF